MGNLHSTLGRLMCTGRAGSQPGLSTWGTLGFLMVWSPGQVPHGRVHLVVCPLSHPCIKPVMTGVTQEREDIPQETLLAGAISGLINIPLTSSQPPLVSQV